MTEGKKIGLQIKGMRKQCGFTQEKVANDLFISQSYLRKIEHGEANPSSQCQHGRKNYLLFGKCAERRRQQGGVLIGTLGVYRLFGSAAASGAGPIRYIWNPGIFRFKAHHMHTRCYNRSACGCENSKMLYSTTTVPDPF